jgi:hypothetical protein
LTRFFQRDMNPPSHWRRVSNVPCSPSPVAASFQLAVSAFPSGRDAPPWTAKLPSLGDSDLPPGAAWHAQQVGHPPRLLHLRRSPATVPPWRRVSNLPCLHSPPWRRVSNLPCVSTFILASVAG